MVSPRRERDSAISEGIPGMINTKQKKANCQATNQQLIYPNHLAPRISDSLRPAMSMAPSQRQREYEEAQKAWLSSLSVYRMHSMVDVRKQTWEH